MQFTAPAGLLSAAIAQATTNVRGIKVEPGASAAQRAASTALHALRLDADGEIVTARCFDRVAAISAHVPATVGVPGSFATSAVKAYNLMAGFPDKTMISFDDGSIVAVAGRYRLPSIPIDRLPMPFVLDGEIVSIEISLPIMQGLLDTLAGANKEETRYFLSGTFWHSVDGNLIAVSTDGKKLIRTIVDAPLFSADRSLVLSASTVITLKKLIAPARPRTLMLRRNKRLLSVGCDQFECVTVLIDYAFPEYERLIPAATANAVIVERNALAAVLARLAATANRPTPLLAAIWTAGELKIFLAQEPDAGTDAIPVTSATSGRFVVPLHQTRALLGELNGSPLAIDANGPGPIMIQIAGDQRKLVLVCQCDWSWT
jgi:DNA polymerase III subunit beta